MPAAAARVRWLWLAAALGRAGSISFPRLIEAKLAKNAVPLVASVDAAEDLRLRGVARINGVLPAAQCAALRLHAGALAERSLDPETAKWAAWMDPDALGRYRRRNQSCEAAPIRGPFRRRFLDARRGETESVRLVQERAESVATRKM